MKRLLAAALFAGLMTAPAHAALPVGAKAPTFTATASMDGKEFKFALADALKKGPVVLYFYPAAFTPGCTIEAHLFADATDEFHSLGATVIGVSADPIDKLNKFSVSECRSKFAVAADADKSIMKSYDSVLAARPELSSRTSYVITPDGKIAMAYSDMKPDMHITNSMAAVKAWKSAKK
ncbi:MAG: peroxiredoxin [Caulobacteraceae bacterium]